MINENKGTSVVLDNRAYSLIIEKQLKIYSEINKKITIQKLVSEAVVNGIDKVFIQKSVSETDSN